MSVVILPHKWRQQPQVPIEADWSSPLLRDCDAVFDGFSLQVPNRIRPFPTSYSASRGACPSGAGWRFTGASTEYVMYDGIRSAAAADTYSVEFIVWGSSFPSLSCLAAVTSVSLTTGAVESGEAGSIRGALAYTGSNPCDIYAWGGGKDFDSNVPFVVNQLQHVVVTKATGTGAAQYNVYRNGVRVAQGNAGGGTFAASGTYLYIGGRHSGGAAPITGVVPFVSMTRREMPADEVAERFKNPWQIFKPLQRRIYVGPAASGFNPAWARNANTVIQRVA